MQGQEGRHFLHVEGLGIQLQAQLVSQIIFLRNAKIAEIGADEQHGIFKNASAGLQHLREIPAVAQDRPELIFPAVVPVENFLHQIEHPENIPASLHQNDAAPVIIGAEVPVLPQTDQAHIFPQLRALGQMIGRAYVHPVLLKGLGTIQIEFRPVQGKRAAPFAPLGDRCQLFFQTPIENIRAQFHAFRPPEFF